MGKKKSKKEKVNANNAVVAANRHVRHDYNILDIYECGAVLVGTEVKALREGKASLNDVFATIGGGEVWLRRLYIPEYFYGSWINHSLRRSRKLLLYRKEIDTLWGKVRDGNNTLVSLKLHFTNGRLRIELVLVRGKQDYDKRQDIKRRMGECEATCALGRRVRGIKGQWALQRGLLTLLVVKRRS